jgi:phosphotransferase system enzyme I (PtsP)
VARDATGLLRDVGRLLVRSHDLAETLANVARLVARWMRASVCSIYLLDDDGETLVLRATRGLAPGSVGRVRLRRGQGIVGACLAAGEPVAVPDVRQDARFRYFPESGESRFRSLLAVPLFVGDHAIGVLTAQTVRPRPFATHEVELLETIAAQVATIVLNARLLDQAAREAGRTQNGPAAEPTPVLPGTVLRGIPISPGIAIGPIHVQPPRLDLAQLRYRPSRSRRAEWRAIEQALRETIRQISDLRAAVGERFGEDLAEVFTTHIMLLEDQGFREKVRRRLAEHGNGARALVETMREYTQVFGAMKDATIRERASDVEDVIRRAVGELVGIRAHHAPLQGGVIVVADRLAPSEFRLLETEKIAGFATSHGGATSHAAIFARSLEIPAVTALPDLERKVEASDQGIVDGIEGIVIVNPTREQLREYRERRVRYARARERLDELRDLPARMQSGEEVMLSANIGGWNDLEHVKRYGARGVGLFRTEMLALSARGFPDEEEQLRAYRRVAETIAPDPVTIRTFDFGGDKVLTGVEEREENPQLGWRSIRMLLDLGEVLPTQLRAILRANTPGNLRVMIPMLTALEELDATRVVLARVAAELGVPPPPLGIMIETPAAVALADRLAAQVDFFSIGTNDLVQYTLAVDRGNERVASGYDPFHPAVIASIRRTVDAALATGIPCSVCGELAGNPVATPLLLGLGIRELSMTPFLVTAVRQVVRAFSLPDVLALARDAERCARGAEVRRCIAQSFADRGLLQDPDFGPALRRLIEPRVDRPRAGR